MIAALPMYDWPEIRIATDAWWAVFSDRLRAQGLPAPGMLERSQPASAVWTDPRLMFGQTCGRPYMAGLRGRVRHIATPHYDVAGCRGADYSSPILVAAGQPANSLEDLAVDAIAINGWQSHSGMTALWAALAPFKRISGIPCRIIKTGAHRRSLKAVAEGRATLCAVDPISWALAEQFDPAVTARLRLIGWSDWAPGLPYIAGQHVSEIQAECLFETLLEVISDPDCAPLNGALHLIGASRPEDVCYGRIVEIERRAEFGPTSLSSEHLEP